MATIEVCPGHAGMTALLKKLATDLAAETESLWRMAAPGTPVQMLRLEERSLEAGRRIADLQIARGIVLAHLDHDFVQRAAHAARQQGDRRIRLTGRGWSWARVRLPGGTELRLKSPYYRPTRKGMRGRPRGHGKRGPSGVGRYSVLQALGISDGVTPMTRSTVCRQVVLCDSYAEAQEQLGLLGLSLNVTTVVRIAVATGTKALVLRDLALDEARRVPLAQTSHVAGKRLRVSIDGGRARTRRTRRGRGVRPGKNGRRPFETPWREPRIVTIDILDDNGKPDASWRPIYEVTLGNADEAFALLTGLLRVLGAHQADEVIFVSDGASWIWERVEALAKDAKIPAERYRTILDYYHASEHLHEALKACKNFSPEERGTQFKAMRGLLLKPGGPQQVLGQLRGLARGRRAAKINQEIRYLERHLDHMRYAEWRAASVPIGSGVVESAVRRIINLRFKSASMCWREDHLEPLLYIRAILKAGRWDTFMESHLKGHHWLTPVPAHERASEDRFRQAA